MNTIVKNLILPFLVVTLCSSSVFAQESYDSMWKEVNKLDDDDLPRKVIDKTQVIFDKAQREKNFPNQMKAWKVLVEKKTDIDPDSFRVDMLPQVRCNNSTEKAVYDAIMATAYLSMNDTHIRDFDEETRAQYSQKAKELFDGVLSDKAALAQANAKDYEPLVKLKDDSRLYNHDLLSLLTRFVIEQAKMTNLEKADMTGEVAEWYKQNGQREGYVLMSLERLTFLHSAEDFNRRLLGDKYENELKRLLDEANGLEAQIDVAKSYMSLLYGDEKLAFARWAQNQLKKDSNTNIFWNIDRDMMQPYADCGIYSRVMADTNIPFVVNFRNMTEVQYEVRRFNGRDKDRNLKTDGRLVLNGQMTLGQDSANLARKAINMPTSGQATDSLRLDAGHYVVILKGQNLKEAVSEFHLTSLRMFALDMPGNKSRIHVVNNKTGQPVPGAKLRYEIDDKKFNATTDHNGEYDIDTDRRSITNLEAYLNDDDYTDDIFISWPRDGSEQYKHYQYKIFTDRAIYRPGQTVYASGIVFTQSGDTTKVVPNSVTTFYLYDANNRKVEEKNATTNAMGSAAVEFVIPKGLLPGQFRISCGNGTEYFRVEEYKRPTFTVESEVQKGQESYSIGDTVNVEAKAMTFSGVPVQGATMKYVISTAQCNFWYVMNSNWEKIGEGEMTTDDDGKVAVPVFLDNKKLTGTDVVRYRIEFTCTDMAGETHTGTCFLAVSSKAFGLSVSIPHVYDRADEKAKAIITARNASQEELDIEGKYIIYRGYREDNIDYEGTFRSGQPIVIPDITAGDYNIKAVAYDKNGKEIEVLSQFSLINSKDAVDLTSKGNVKPTLFTDDFLYCSSPFFSPDKGTDIYYSPEFDDAYVYCYILSNKKLVDCKKATLTRGMYKIHLDYKADYEDGVSVRFIYVKNNEVHQKEQHISLERPEKRLHLEWKTFRDKLRPGQEEEWILTIKDQKGKPVSGAELLAGMYDASLNEIAYHDWWFNLSFPRNIKYYNLRSTSSNRFSGGSIGSRSVSSYTPPREWDELTEFVHQRWARFNERMVGSRAPVMRAKGFGGMVESAPAVFEAEREEDALAETAINEDVSANDADNNGKKEGGSQNQIRTNFNETAFFYPHLLSDKNGDVSISFTLPESLTEWKFMGLAHTKDVDYGIFTDEMVARKEFMVQPNMPRFVRQGDKVSIVARIINQDEKPINGMAHMKLINPDNDEVIIERDAPFSVETGKTTSVDFQFDAPEQYPMLVCEITGEGNDCSDGERNYLPVLTSKKYITESIPFYFEKEENQKTLDLSSLFNDGSKTATMKRMKLEYTANPSWYVIGALEGIKLPEYDNAPCFAASLYANKMGQKLANSIPGLYDYLKQQQNKGETATSQLDENEDLKDIIMKESPWVRDALKEAKQRDDLIDFFNTDFMNQRIRQATEKLAKLQRHDGSWSWFEGMEGSYYITLSVCSSLALLQHDANDNTDYGLDKAMKYLDKQELKDFDYKKKHKMSMLPDNSTMEYLYIWSMMPDRKVSKDLQTMRETYLKEIEKNIKTLTIYGRANAATVLRTFGHEKSANLFLESIMEYSVTKPGMGRFFNTDIAYYSWKDYRIPTQLAAMKAVKNAIDAKLSFLNTDLYTQTSTLADMQMWLLRQKQTQTWDNPMNTIGAVSIMLATDGKEGDTSDATASEVSNTPLTATISGNVIPTPIDTTRFMAEKLGYINTSISDDIVNSKLESMDVTRNQTAETTAFNASKLSWGAVYAQYLEDLSALKSESSGELRIERKLYIDSAGEWKEWNGGELKVGDKVKVRLIITADRDMDFVQVRSQHPACFESVRQRSGYQMMGGRGGYLALHDASADIFFDRFTRGTSTVDLEFFVNRTGEYQFGVATAQCAYSPEFVGHTGGQKMIVK